MTPGTSPGQYKLLSGCFLGADDRLAAPDVLALAMPTMLQVSPEVIFISGDVKVMGSDGLPTLELHGLGLDAPDLLRAGKSAQHSGLFQRSTIFEKNTFNTSFKISGDHDLICRLWKHQKQGHRLGFTITIMSRGGVTSSIRGVWRFRWELAYVLYKHYGVISVLPCLKGLIKGFIPFLLVTFYGPDRAAHIHNRIRKYFGKPPAWPEIISRQK
jgi:hypothetical protein